MYDVQLTPDQSAFARQAVEAGRLASEEDAVQQAFSLWEERQRRRLEVLSAVDEAEASLARGEGVPVTRESMRELAESVKQKGRARLAAEQTAPRLIGHRRSSGGFRSRRHLVLRGDPEREPGSRGSPDRLSYGPFLSSCQPPQYGSARDEDLRPGLRSFPIGEYLILYRIEGEDVLILRVIRGSRDISALL